VDGPGEAQAGVPGDGDEGAFGGEPGRGRLRRGGDVPAADFPVGRFRGGLAVAAGGAASEAQQVVLAAQPWVGEGLPGALDEMELVFVAAAVGVGLAQPAAVGRLDVGLRRLRLTPRTR
jgi:hypothetical protein